MIRLIQIPVLVIAVFGVAGCGQRPPVCETGHGAFAAKYTLIEGNGQCSTLLGDRIGVQTYYAAGEVGPDLNAPRVGMRALRMGEAMAARARAGLSDGDEANQPTALADFQETNPDDDGKCPVEAFTIAKQSLPAVPASDDDPGLPATVLTYRWSDVTFFVSTATPGTMFTARLDYEEDGCQAAYNVTGLYPAVDCEGTDEEGNPTGEPDETLCRPTADPTLGRATGSGINPDLKTKCEPGLLLCVLDQEPAAL